jgi:hypothetical protein
MKLQVLVPLLCLVGLVASPADAKTYSAERFDSYIRVLTGGAIEVTETVVFRFEDGSFTYVFREIPRRRTDSVKALRATMDGREFPIGDRPGQVEVGGRSRLRVRWHFTAPVFDSTHTFTLTYRVEGAVRQSEDGDLLAWRALPGEHRYSIETSTIEIEPPAPLARQPDVDTNRVEGVLVQEAGQTVRVTASAIRRNGWVEARLYFAGGSIIASPPAWQRAEQRADALAPRWMWAAGLISAAGLILMWSMRLRYDTPRRDGSLTGPIAAPPDSHGPAIAGALAANGRVALPQAMAALFSLADRGEILIREEPRGMLGQRNFILERRRNVRPLAGHEQVALDLAFRDKQREDPQVPLAKARSRLQSHFKRFRVAVHDEMDAMGLIDRERKAVHARYGGFSLGLILVGAVLFIVCAALVREYRGWPLMVPAAIILVALVGFAFQAATTPLSNEGVRTGDRWRAYQRHLKEVARRETHLTAESPSRVLPFAVALGLSAAWAKFIKAHPTQVPPWFQALSASDENGAFYAFVGQGGHAGADGGAGAGGAAGGGSSGAG